MASHDGLEDAVRGLISASVPVFVVATIALWFLARPGGSQRWKRASIAALASSGLALLVNQVIGHLWDRPRPYVSHPATIVLADRSADPSFPSDHAAAAFAIAFAVLAYSLPVGMTLLAGATVVALSRIVGGLHYPGDVLAGAGVGLLAALAVVTLAREPVEHVAAFGSQFTDPLVRPVRTRIEAALRPLRRRRA